MRELCPSRAVQHVNVFSGQHLIGTWNPAAGKVYYAYSDWLGTKRYEADGAGTYVNSWTSLPFGDNETALGTGTDATEHHFTGKEHDAESGLDYFKARYYQSQTGRWLLPDWSETPVPVPYASFTNPQSLNLYTYVGNNPVNAVDADGHVQNGQDGSSRTGEGVTQPQACGTQNADAVTSNNSVCVVVQDGTTTPTASPSQAAANNQVNQSNEAPAQQQNNTTGYATQDQAAKAVLTWLNPQSIKEYKEYAGLIYKDANGLFHYNTPNPGTDTSSPVGTIPAGTTEYGDYHTHGDYSAPGPTPGTTVRTDKAHDRYNSDHFSTDDKQQNRDSARSNPAFRGYLGTPSGALLIYNPITNKEGPLQ